MTDMEIENIIVKGTLKIQRPLATNAATPQALCYTENKDILFLMEFDIDVKELFEKDELKVFCKYTIIDSMCYIGARVEDQDW